MASGSEGYLFGLITPDGRDLFYLISGAAFFGLTILPRLRHVPFIAAPPLYLMAGVLLALTPLMFALPDPLSHAAIEATPLAIIEHASEAIVIISLAGAGLAIDTALGWRRWMTVWRQLLVTMPLTIVVLAWGGIALIGLPVASAMLLAAALSPTDPVLARAVQVGGPTEGNEGAVRLGLTGEAGFNDGLAFPFVYLAIAMAGLAVAPAWSDLGADWFLSWLWFDLIYRVLFAIVIGWAFGNLVARLTYSELGDAGNHHERGENAGLVMLASTFACYGLTELLSAYGFLAVFVSALVARSYARGHETRDPYVKHPHRFGEQAESILLALLLLWLGGTVAGGLLDGWRWQEVAYAAGLVLLVRPLAGIVANSGLNLPFGEKLALAFFGVRGLGSVFYLAYGLNHAEFAGAEPMWRTLALTMAISILLHGFTARPLMKRLAPASD